MIAKEKTFNVYCRISYMLVITAKDKNEAIKNAYEEAPSGNIEIDDIQEAK